MPSLMEFIFGSGDKKVPNYNQGQNQNLDQLTKLTQQGGQGAESVLQYLMQFMDPNSDIYKNFEQPYLDEHQDEIGSLAERFAGKGALSSSGFGQALGASSAGLQNKLAALKSGMQRQAGQDIFGQYNQQASQALGARPFDYREGNLGLLSTGITSYLGGMGGGGGGDALIKQLMSTLSGRNSKTGSGAGQIGGQIARTGAGY